MPNSRTFVLGDVHGAYRALMQCFERSGFDYENDHLICLGDVCDGWPETSKCFDELLKVKHLIYILGNHDLWARDWMEYGYKPEIWVTQGGEATLKSYPEGTVDAHLQVLKNAKDYYLLDNRLFVHAGIIPDKPLDQQGQDIYLWDRNLFYTALDRQMHNHGGRLTQYEEVYIGHTPINRLGRLEPTKACEVWLMDTGAGWDGVLSIMDISSKKYYISDLVTKLYPDHPGRF